MEETLRKSMLRIGTPVIFWGCFINAQANPHNEVDAGSQIDMAEILPPGTTSVNGSVGVTGDCDLYCFHIPFGGNWTIGMSSTAVDSNLLLFDGDGNPLAGDDDGGSGIDSQISLFLLAGNYYIGCGQFEMTGYKDAALTQPILGVGGPVGGEEGSYPRSIAGQCCSMPPVNASPPMMMTPWPALPTVRSVATSRPRSTI